MGLKLTSAKILGDGVTLKMQFEGGLSVDQTSLNRLNNCGFFDYLPSKNKNIFATVDGQSIEVIGVQAEDWNMPLPWIEPPVQNGNFLAGSYYFLVSIVDSNGNEIYTGPPIFAYGEEQGVAIGNNQKVLINWRVPVLPNQSVNIYACTKSPISQNLSLIANVLFKDLASPTSYMITQANFSQKIWNPQSVCVTVTGLLSKIVTCNSQAILNIPSNLIVDENGLGNDSVVNFNINNMSLVNQVGFLATDKFTFAKSYFISYSRGSDSPDAGTIDKPFKTKKYADTIVKSDQKNVRFAWLRGDVWPADQWKTAHWGTGLTTPTLYESYWNPVYGPDPYVRPVLQDSSDPVANNNGWFWFGQGDTTVGGRAIHGAWPYQYFRGLNFQRDTKLTANGNSWPTNTANDFVVFSDCMFQNICLVGTYGSAQHIAPIGCMFHRSLVHSALSSPTYQAHVQGVFIAHCGDWLFSQSQFVQNGWKDLTNPQYNDMFNHNLYLSAMSRQIIVHSCYVIDGCLSGLQMRGGGVAAYNVFAGNASHFTSCDTHMCYKNLFFNMGVYNHTVSAGPSYGYNGIHDFNLSIGNSGLNENRTPVINFDGISCFHHNSTGPNYPTYLAMRHETSIDCGGISLGNKLSNKKTLIDHNLILNRKTNGVDYKKNPLRSLAYRSTVVPTNSLSCNNNLYQQTSCTSNFLFGSQSSKNMLIWQAQGFDNDSITLNVDPTFNAKTLPTVNYINQITSMFKKRVEYSWSGMYDARYTYNDYVGQYTPNNIPAVDQTTDGYFGAKDYRQGV